MKRILMCAWFLLTVVPLWPLDFDRYEPELVRTYGIGQGLAEFKVDFEQTLTAGASAIAFDRAGDAYFCDALRKRLVVGDRALEIREEYYGIQSGHTLRLEVTERGIGNHHFIRAYSWVDRAFKDSFMVWSSEGRYDPEPDSSLYYGDVVFAYLRDGSLISVVKPGLDSKANDAKVLRAAKTRELFREPEKYGLTGLTVDDSGRLFVNGEIETRSYRKFLSWCEEKHDWKVAKRGNAAGSGWDPRLSSQTAGYLGKDANGNTYWVDSLLVLIFSREGELIDLVKPTDKTFIQAVHPSGDLYRFPYAEDKVRLERIRNVWDPKARELWEAYVISTTGEGIRSAEVTAGPLRVRRAAGPMAEIEGELAKGDRVEVLWHGSAKEQIDGFDEYWYEVRRNSDGLQGWVYGGYLRIEP